MPVIDPLTKTLGAWTRADLDALMGRVEGEHLELKGASTDITSRPARQAIARELAGMISSWGGFVIVGTVEGRDDVTGYPGLAVGADEVEALRRSLQDLIRPSPAFFRGPQLIDADDDGRHVIVIEAAAHPTGLPASVGGRFYVRVGDETRPMDYREVQRRFSTVRDATEAARAAAIEAANDAGGPIERHDSMSTTTSTGAHRQYHPLTIGIVPTTAQRDLSLTGRELLVACREAAEAEHAAHLSVDSQAANLFYDTANTVVGGVIADASPYSVLRFSHNGIFGAAHLTNAYPFAEGTGVDPRYVGALMARLSAVGLLAIAATAGPTAVYVVASSGSIPAIARGFPLPDSPNLLMPQRQARVEFASDVRGAGAVRAVAEGSRVLAARTGDATVGPPSEGVARDDLAEYLNSLLA